MSHGSFHHLHAPRWQWWSIFLFGVATLIFGSIGVWQYEEGPAKPGIHQTKASAEEAVSGGHEAKPTEPTSWLDQPISRMSSPLYHAVQMLILHTSHFEHGPNFCLDVGRWCGAFTVFSATLVLVGRRIRSEFRLFRLSLWNDHHVICGLGSKGYEIALCLRKHNRNACIVFLDPHPDPELAEKCEHRGILLLPLDGAQPQALQRARVAQAREVIVVTPEDETNLRIAAEVRAQWGAAAGKGPACHVHLSDIHLREALQEWVEADRQRGTVGALHFFDVFDHEARRVLRELPLDGEGIGAEDPRSVHVVLLGFGRMGRSLAVRAAKMGQFANGKPLRISVIDRNARQQSERYLFRYPVLEGKTICALKFYPEEAESLSTRKLIAQWAAEPDTLLHVLVCLDDDARAVEVALRLKSMLWQRPGCHVRVRIRSHESLAPMLSAAASSPNHLTHFGVVEDTCADTAFRPELTDALARTIHEQFRLERGATSQRTPENDPAMRPWAELREDLRESNRSQADHIAIKLRAVRCLMVPADHAGTPVEEFTPAELDLLARLEHRRWNAERWLGGWRYGTPSNKDLRISENLVSWEELDDSIKQYDVQAVARIPALLRQMNPPRKIIRVE